MKIRITKTPPGAVAPEEIRQQWIGVELPVATDSDPGSSNWVDVPENVGGYIVNTTDAIVALRELGRHAAADFWEEIRAMTGHQLRFGTQFCEVV